VQDSTVPRQLPLLWDAHCWQAVQSPVSHASVLAGAPVQNDALVALPHDDQQARQKMQLATAL
jgi:hypothetical protein